MITPQSSIQNLETQAIGTLGTIPAIEGQRQVSKNEGTTTIIDQILKRIRSLFSNLNTAENRTVSLTANNTANNEFLNKFDKDLSKELSSLSPENQKKLLNVLKEKEKSIQGTVQVTQDVSCQLYELHKAKILTDVLSVSSPLLQDNSEKQNLIKTYIAYNLDIRQSGFSYSKFDTWANNNPRKLEKLISSILYAEKDPSFMTEIVISKKLKSAAEKIEKTAIQSKPENQNATQNL